MDFADAFDAPVIEPVKGIGDVLFSRADMEYWAQWAAALKAKRAKQHKDDLDKMPSISPLAKAQSISQLQDIQIFEVLNQQYTPEGIKKILNDAYLRAGGDGEKWPQVAKRIPPMRQQQLAAEICSEPIPTTVELRESLRELLRKAKKPLLPGIESMTDEELIAAANEFQPEKDNPLADTGSDNRSDPTSIIAATSSDTSLDATQAA